MEQKNYKRTSLKDRKMEVEQVMEKWKNAFHDFGCYVNIPKSEFVWSTTMPNCEYVYMEDIDTEVLHFIDNFDLDNCTINQIRQANKYLEHDLTTSTELQLKVLLNKIDNKIRSKIDDAPFKKYHEDLITGKTKIDINKKTDDEKALEYIRNFDISKANETHSSYITETLFQLNINDDTTNKLIKLLNDIETEVNRKEHKELNKKALKILSDRIGNNNKKTLFVPQKSKEEISMIDEKSYDEIIGKNTDVYSTYKINYGYLDNFILNFINVNFDNTDDTLSKIKELTELLKDDSINYVYKSQLNYLKVYTLSYFKHAKMSKELQNTINELNKTDIVKEGKPEVCVESGVIAEGTEDVETIFSLEDFANEQKEFFDKLYNLGRVKQKEYSRGKSAFHNFERSKDLSFHKTRTKSAWEYMVKHLQSVKDLLDDEERGEYIDPKVVDEKIGDIIIYMTLIRSMLIN